MGGDDLSQDYQSEKCLKFLLNFKMLFSSIAVHVLLALGVDAATQHPKVKLRLESNHKFTVKGAGCHNIYVGGITHVLKISEGWAVDYYHGKDCTEGFEEVYDYGNNTPIEVSNVVTNSYIRSVVLYRYEG